MRVCRGCLVRLRKNEGRRFYDYRKRFYYLLCQTCITKINIQLGGK